MHPISLEKHLNDLLKVDSINDYCPNGLQVEGGPLIQKVVTGVTASRALIEKAISIDADAVIVHHGYFWKNEDPRIRGVKKGRIQRLLNHDISLFAYHLPLDFHPVLGNNAQFGKFMGFEGMPDVVDGFPGLVADLSVALSVDELSSMLKAKLNREPLVVGPQLEHIRKVAWCTGAGQGYLDLLAGTGIDAYISGEISEPTVHVAMEEGICYYSAGHHATEIFGVRALADYLKQELGLDARFCDLAIPV